MLFRSVEVPADGFEDGAGGGDDEAAVEVADRGDAAVLFPDLGGDGVFDQLDEVLGALGLGLALVFLVLLVHAAALRAEETAVLGLSPAAADSTAASAAAAAAPTLLAVLAGVEAEARGVGEIRHFHEQILHVV